ncbi:MAG: nucleotidyl transferase AbiEii/AbiGii toxin family protein [Bacteroidetes bacterium]|nr:nucleotidyl transferase AbiEii/AbiGii toxin family protein [Bacteroidota bacterium]MBL6944399.1 nucleotidyl transferase AbiEii/AbiGii toxin family protein [Bacteroidales bacterium]
MLHKETVDKSTLDLLKQLQSKKYLKGFYLVGGTALALRIGHRKSIDIDLFSDFDFDVTQTLENLSSDFNYKLYFSANNTLKGSIDNVQVDILAHRYPLIQEPCTAEGITMLSLQDILAMKLNAITGSGQRVKDFIDVYYLLREFTMSEMIDFYSTKYKQYNEVNVLKSITYFNDVDLADWPQLTDNPLLKWDDVKASLSNAAKKCFLQT